MITSIELKNFKGHQDSKIELDPEQRICCLVGPNGSGKSSFLHAVDLVAQLFLRPFENVLPGDSAIELIRSGASFFEIILEGQPSMSSIGKSRIKSWKYFVRIEGSQAGAVKAKWKITQHLQGGDKLEEKEGMLNSDLSVEETIDSNPSERFDRESFFPELRDELANAIFVSPEITYLRAPADIKGVNPLPSGKGEDLADVLAAWATRQPEKLKELTDLAKEVIPSLKEIRFNRLESSDKKIQHQLMIDSYTGKSIPATQMSTGTLLTISILAHLVSVSKDQAKVLLLDDVERGLHPRAQQDFITSLKAILQRFTDLQAILITHSPFVVDGIPLNCTWVLAQDEDGRIAPGNLSTAPKVTDSDILSNGEIWGVNGEAWALMKGI